MDWENLQPDVYKLLSTHYTEGRSGATIDKIIVHYNAGDLTVEGCYSVWQTRPASAHYQVESGGRIGQFVNDWDTAWHAGDWNANITSIGIEHANKTGGYITDKCLDAGAHLVAALCKYYGLGRPEWLKNVFPHKYFQATACPGQIYGAQKDAYIQRAQEWYDAMTGTKPAPSPTPTPTPTPSKKINVVYQSYDSTHGWLPEITNWNNQNTDGYSGWLGYPIKAFRAKTPGDVADVGNLEYRVHCLGGGWYGWRRDYEKDNVGDTFAGTGGTKLDGLQMRIVNISGKNVRYRVHCIGKGWLDWVTNYGDGNEGYAGWYGYAIDAVQVEVV